MNFFINVILAIRLRSLLFLISETESYKVNNLRIVFSWKRFRFMIKGNILYPVVDIRNPGVIESYDEIEQIWNLYGINTNTNINFKAPTLNYEHINIKQR